MVKKLKLSIHEPCHENWEGMTPVDKGKFCGSCQKQVIDFSNMSDRQIAEFFKKPSTGSVCGRFMNDQLDRTIDIPKKRIPWVKYFFQILLPAFFISKASAQKMGKVAPSIHKDSSRLIKDYGFKGEVVSTILPVVNEERRTIGEVENVRPLTDIVRKGKILDENGQPVSKATIYIKGSGAITGSGNNGRFSISCTESDVLVVSAAGYSDFEMKVLSRKTFVVRLKKVEQCERYPTTGLITIDRLQDE